VKGGKIENKNDSYLLLLSMTFAGNALADDNVPEQLSDEIKSASFALTSLMVYETMLDKFSAKAQDCCGMRILR
jgi:hypothetical protein